MLETRHPRDPHGGAGTARRGFTAQQSITNLLRTESLVQGAAGAQAGTTVADLNGTLGLMGVGH